MGRRVGVVFVHGIGQQRRGAALSGFGDPLLSWMREWTERRAGTLEVLTTAPDPAGPASVKVAWARHDADPVDLTIAECWWAEAFSQPTLGNVLRWAPGLGYRLLARTPFLPILIGYIILMLVIAIGSGWSARAWFGLALAAGTLASLPYVLVMILSVLRFVPTLRGFAKSAMSWLVSAGGDAYSLMRSETQFAAMRGAFVRDLEWMRRHADSLVVVAHSQGSVIAVESLARREDLPVHTVITLGSAIRLLKLKGADPVDRFKTAHPDTWWMNVFSGLDPVSAGPINGSGCYPIEIKVTHEGMPWSAHTSYPSDVEGLQMLVMGAVAEAAGSSIWTTEVATEVREALAARAVRSQLAILDQIVAIGACIGIAACAWSSDYPARASDWLLGWKTLPAPLSFLDADASRSLTAGVICVAAAAATWLAHMAFFANPAKAMWRRHWAARLAAGDSRQRRDPLALLTTAALLPLSILTLSIVKVLLPTELGWAAFMMGAGLSIHLIITSAAFWRKDSYRQAPHIPSMPAPGSLRSLLPEVSEEVLTLPDRYPEPFIALFGPQFSAYRDRMCGINELAREIARSGRRLLESCAISDLTAAAPSLQPSSNGLLLHPSGSRLQVKALHAHAGADSSNHQFMIGSTTFSEADGPTHLCFAVCTQQSGCLPDARNTWLLRYHLVSLDAARREASQSGMFGSAFATWAAISKVAGDGVDASVLPKELDRVLRAVTAQPNQP